MEEQGLLTCTTVVQSLEMAALIPRQRTEMIAHALEDIFKCTAAVGTALIWPCMDRKIPWKVYYAGMNRHVMQRWLASRLDSSLDVMTGVLQHDLASSLSDMPPPLLMHVQAPSLFSSALWIVWKWKAEKNCISLQVPPCMTEHLPKPCHMATPLHYPSSSA